jgi:hypothetical protein
MENQELPKNLTPEEIEKQKENLEKKDKKTEQPIEKDDSALLSDVNKKIQKKTQIIEDTKNKIDEILNELGLPSSDEIPPSVKIEEKLITQLNEEKTNLESNIKKSEVSEESQENIKKFEGNLRSAIDDISTKSKTMLDALYERQQQQFTPLQNPDELQGIVSHLKSIKNFDGKFDINGIDQINENIQKISRLIENMNPKNTGGGVRDNPQSLEKLAYGAKTFSASLDEAGRNLGPELADEKMEEKRKELRKSLGILSEQVQKLNSLALRMRSNFR